HDRPACAVHGRRTQDQRVPGDPGQPAPPPPRLAGRNHRWRHVDCADVISMPDKWEYPWFAAWDLAFHCIALAHVDLDLAKSQLARVVDAPERPAPGVRVVVRRRQPGGPAAGRAPGVLDRRENGPRLPG